jgi:hypothetical protein
MTRISKLAYQIVADAQQFQRGVTLTRQELALQNKVFRESIDPATAYAAELTALEQLHAKGAITADQYSSASQRLHEQHQGATQTVQAVSAEEQALADALQQTTDRLNEQIATAGMTADEIELYRLTVAGANDEQLAAVQSLQQQAAGLRATGETAEEMAGQIRNAATAVTTIVGITTGGMAMLGREMVATYQVQEAAEAQLAAAMRARGTQTEEQTRQYMAFASEMQRVTVVGDEMTLGLLAQAETMGSTGEAAERAARNAISLSAAFGLSADSAIRMTAALETGDTTMLQRYMRELKLIEDPTQRAAEAQRLLANMFASAEAEALTTAGAMAQMNNAVGDAYEGVGEFVAQALLPAVDAIRSTAEAFNGMGDSTKQAVAYAGLAAVGLGAVATAGAGAVAIGGQLVISYTALSKALASVSVTSRMASVGLATVGPAGLAAAGAVGAIVGYQVGHWLYDVTEAGQTTARMFDDLAASMQSVSQVDVTGTATEDLEDYIAATQRQIEAVEQHNQQLNEGQAWWNFWQRNRDLIQVNSDQVDVLRDNLNRAQLELAQQNQAVNPLTVDQEALDALDQVTARLQEQIAVTGYSADEAERWKLAQAGVTQEQLRTVAAMQQQAAAATSAAELRDDTNALVDALSYTIDTAHLSADALQIADLRARGLSESWITLIEKLQQGAAAAQEAAAAQADLDQLTASLQEQIVTAGMSADELERWRLAQRGIGDAALQTVAALQEQRNEAQRVADVAGSIDQITQALTEQIATAGMSADQAELWRLAQAGATDEQLRQVAALQEQALAAKEATDAKRDLARADQDLTAAQRGSSEALERIQAYEALLAGANEPPAPPPAALPTPDVIAPGPTVDRDAHAGRDPAAGPTGDGHAHAGRDPAPGPTVDRDAHAGFRRARPGGPIHRRPVARCASGSGSGPTGLSGLDHRQLAHRPASGASGAGSAAGQRHRAKRPPRGPAVQDRRRLRAIG